MIFLDFETRSRVDLKKVGTSVYARHPSTEILCLAWSGPMGDHVWTRDDLVVSVELLWLFKLIQAGHPIEAHNAFFERNIWEHICFKRFMWPRIADEQWRCSLAACSRLALPRSLEDAGKALGLSVQKDTEGRKIMLQLCKPKRDGTWDETPEKHKRLHRYCAHDVASEKAIHEHIEPLAGRELQLWRLDQQINLRGIAIDRGAIRYAISIVDATYTECCESLNRLTNGKVQTPKQVSALSAWLSGHGVDIPSLAKTDVSEMLADSSIPATARQALELRQIAAKASTAKLKSMIDHCDEDDRVRGNLVYHGASTGRWAGAGIQIQNFPRGNLSPEEIELVHRVLPSRNGRYLDLLLGPTMDCISSSLRSMIIAEPGKRLLVCDFASIEARVLAWLAGQLDLLEIFRANGDVYKAMAAKIYSVPAAEVTKAQRQIGKIAILGLGYGMGAKAFQQTCKLMAGVEIDRKFAKQVVRAYRNSNDKIVEFWGALNRACVSSIQTKQPHRVGRLEVSTDDDWMRIKLPGGRLLHYREPELIQVVAPWSVGWFGTIYGDESIENSLLNLDIDLGDREQDCWVDCHVPHKSDLQKLGVESELDEKEKKYIQQIQYKGVGLNRKWEKQRTYAGKLAENTTQAVARDFLAEAMLRLDAQGYPIVATVHDEVVCEVPQGFGSIEEMETIMREVPYWGLGCPIEVEGFESVRYQK